MEPGRPAPETALAARREAWDANEDPLFADPFDWLKLAQEPQAASAAHASAAQAPAAHASAAQVPAAYASAAQAPAAHARAPAPASADPDALADWLADLDDDELRTRRAQLTARLAVSPLPPEVRQNLVRQRDAVEWVQHQRQVERGQVPSALAGLPSADELEGAAPLQGAEALDVGARARLESALRSGGAADEQRTYLHLAMRATGAQASALSRQHIALGAELRAFRAQLRDTALRTAEVMLDASTRELEAVLAQYGLVGGSFRMKEAAQQYLRDPDTLPQIVADWRTLSHQPERAGASKRGAAAQRELAVVVAELRVRQARFEALEREERDFTEHDWMQRDAVDPSRNSQTARSELAEAWLAAEAEHPVLLAFRHPSHGADTDLLGGLTTAGAGMEEAVLQQAVPKLGHILRTKHELREGRLDPVRLGPVLEVAKQQLRVPPGSSRATLVAELHREATATPLGEHVRSALSLGLSLLAFVPGVGLGAKVLAEAANLALELHAQVHEYKEWRTAGGLNNTALDMARSVSLQAPALRPLLLRLAVAGAGAASLVQLGRLALQLDHAHALGTASKLGGEVGEVAGAAGVLRQLDHLGDSHGVAHLGAQVQAIGGVRGAAVYAKKAFVKDGLERMSKLNPEKVRDALKKTMARTHVGGARLETRLADATADSASATLHIPARPSAQAGHLAQVRGPTAQAVQAGARAQHAGAAEVRVDLRFQGELPVSAAHGADAGPARYSLNRAADGRWSARIQLDQHLDPRDVEFVLGHELDEIAELIHRYPEGVPPGGFEREMAASVMRDGATSTRATAHDVANAREIVALHADHQKLLSTRSPNATPRKEMLDRAIDSAGLGEASQIDAKVRLLQEAGAPAELLDQVRRVESERVASLLAAKDPARGNALSEELIDHVLWARERSKADFITNGMSGGHHTDRLLSMGWPNGEYVFVELSSKPAAGSIARHYEQYKWIGPGHMPQPHSGRFPSDRGFDSAGWVKSKMPKTTMDNAAILLEEAEEAWRVWRSAGEVPVGQANGFSARTKSGLQITGFYELSNGAKVPTSIFIEASWF